MEKKTKLILLGFGVVTFGVGGYFLYKYLKNKSDLQTTEDFKEAVTEDDLTKIPITSTSTKSDVVNVPHSSTFPLKLKSKGSLVKEVQQALIKKYGASILPKYGADGVYGNELFTALLSKGLPTWIDSGAFTKILAINNKVDNTTNPVDKKQDAWSGERISNYLHKAIENNNIFYALDALKKIENISKYKSTSTEFKKKKINGVSKTVVTGLLDKFSSADYKKKLNEHFHRIGLKFDGKVWTLSGLGRELITRKQTKIWDKDGKSILVPANTFLGDYLREQNGIIQFLTQDDKQLYVQSLSIQFL